MYYALMCGIWAQLSMGRLVSSIVLCAPGRKNGFFLAPRGHSRPAPRILSRLFSFPFSSLFFTGYPFPKLRSQIGGRARPFQFPCAVYFSIITAYPAVLLRARLYFPPAARRAVRNCQNHPNKRGRTAGCLDFVSCV